MSYFLSLFFLFSSFIFIVSFLDASPFSLCCPSFYTTLARPQSLHVRVYKQGEGFYGPGRGHFWQDKTPDRGDNPPFLAITTKRMDGPSNWYTVYHAPSYTFPPTQTNHTPIACLAVDPPPLAVDTPPPPSPCSACSPCSDRYLPFSGCYPPPDQPASPAEARFDERGIGR